MSFPGAASRAGAITKWTFYQQCVKAQKSFLLKSAQKVSLDTIMRFAGSPHGARHILCCCSRASQHPAQWMQSMISACCEYCRPHVCLTVRNWLPVKIADVSFERKLAIITCMQCQSYLFHQLIIALSLQLFTVDECAIGGPQIHQVGSHSFNSQPLVTNLVRAPATTNRQAVSPDVRAVDSSY